MGNGYITLAFSGLPNAQHGEQKQKWLPDLCPIGGPKMGNKNGYISLAFSGVPSTRHGEQNQKWLLKDYNIRSPKRAMAT